MTFRWPRARALAPAALVIASLFDASGASAQELSSAVAQPYATPQQQIAATVQSYQDALEERVRQATSLQELVGDMPVDEVLAPDMKCLAQAVYFEARGEPLAGQLAVAEVVINRARSGYYPSDYCSVITQRAQFSFVRRGIIPQADETSLAWRRAKAIAQIAQQDLWESEAGNALFFHATYVRPSWARQKTQLAQIDTHIFYR